MKYDCHWAQHFKWMQNSWAQLRKERVQLSPGLGFNTEQLGLHRAFHAADFELLSRCFTSDVSFRHSISGTVGHCPPFCVCLALSHGHELQPRREGIIAPLCSASQGAKRCFWCPPAQLVASTAAGGENVPPPPPTMAFRKLLYGV